MSKRYKPVGWRGEPHRHYLAAKGIKTRYNAGKYKNGAWAHKPGHMSDDMSDMDDMVMKGRMDTGDVLEESVEQPAELTRRTSQATGQVSGRATRTTGDILEDVTDIPKEVSMDMQFRNDFKLSDAAVMPGSLAKDTGAAIGDMVRFASDVTRK